MARSTQTVLIDDIDGTEATETMTFTVNGISYELDLNKDNAEKFHKTFDEWISHARRTGGRARRGTGKSSSPSDAAKIREWAQKNGYEVSERGRVAKEIRDAYYAAK